MKQCLLRGSEGAATLRSKASLDMGSLYMLQSLLRRLNQCVHVAYERMDYVQAGACNDVCPGSEGQTYMRRRDARNNGRVYGRGKNDAFPPPPHRSDTGVIPNFSQPFLWLGNFSQHSPQFCTLPN